MTPGRGSDDRVHPTLDDPVVTALSDSVGGPVGEHTGRHRWWTPVRVVLALTALCFAIGMVQKAPCHVASWQDGDAQYSQMCYSDLPYLYTGRGFVELNWPYTDDPQVRDRYDVMEYPVGIAYYAWGAAWVTHWLNGSPDITPRFSQGVGVALLRRGGLEGDQDLRRRQRRRVRGGGAARRVAAERRESEAAVGRRPVRPLPGARPERAGQLGHARRAARGGGPVGLGTGQTRAHRRADRPRHRDQAVSPAAARRDPGDLPARPAGPRLRADHRRRGGGVGAGQPAGVPHRPRAVAGLLALQRGARRRPRVDLAGAVPGAGRHVPGEHDQHGLVGVPRRLVPGRARHRAARPGDAAAGAARVPRRRGVPAGQQGLLAAVRALVAARSP